MKKITPAILALFLCAWGHLACAQMASFFPGPGTVHTAGGFAGAGDVSSGASDFLSCARAYNAASANTSTNLCDAVAVTGGAAVCTLRASSSGKVDLTAYCPGSLTPSAACAAASGGSCLITKMYDGSGNSRHATQLTLASMPALTFNALGGLPGVTFSSTQLLTITAFAVTQPFFISSVSIRTSGTNYTCILCATGSNAPGLLYNNAANGILIFGGNTGSTAVVSDNAFHAIGALFNATTSQAFIDGTGLGTVSAGAGNFGAFNLQMGNFSGTSLLGTISEVVLYPSDISASAAALSANQHSAGNGYNF